MLYCVTRFVSPNQNDYHRTLVEIREIIPNVSYKLSSDKSFQVILTNYYQRIIANIILIQLLSEKSLKTFVTNYYQTNHCEQYLKTFITESFQTIYIRTYCYQRNHSKQILQTITRKITANYAYKSLSDNSIHFK